MKKILLCFFIFFIIFGCQRIPKTYKGHKLFPVKATITGIGESTHGFIVNQYACAVEYTIDSGGEYNGFITFPPIMGMSVSVMCCIVDGDTLCINKVSQYKDKSIYD